jgi:KaiC/GvpD/RAD55 family RecA-like ATPase
VESLTKSLRARKHIGKPIPTVFPKLAAQGADIRRGNLLLIASGPNRGKTLLAMILAIKSGLRVLYVAPDSDEHDLSVRAGAILTGDQLSDVDAAFESGENDVYLDFLAAFVENRIRFVWESPLTLEELGEEIDAYGMTYGSYPELIIIDNLSDIYAHDDEGQSLRLASEWLKTSAQETGAAVIALHHLDGVYDDGVESPPLTALRHKIGKKPNQVWTLWGSALSNVLRVNIVKNKGGPSSPAGNMTVELKVDYSKAEIR